jgi:gliding motility-associated-like protein
MRSTRLLVIFFVLFLSSSHTLNSQISSLVFAKVYAKDSLQGFDHNQAKVNALGEGFYGADYDAAIDWYKRQFVINKYQLNDALINPVGVSGGKYSPGFTSNAPCVNEGFESGTLNGWSAFRGNNANSQAYPSTPTSIGLGSDIAIATTPLTDPYVGSIPHSPLGGTRVVRLNNNLANFSVVKLTQTFSVTPNNYLFDFAYWAVMQDAGSSGLPHTCSETPFMLIKIRDNSNILQGCPTFSIVAPASGTGGCPGLGPLTWSTVVSGSNVIKTSNGWQKFSIDLTPYLTSPASNITVEVFVGDCSLGGHWGYAYFDAGCNTMDLTVNTQTISMPSPTVYPQVQCGGTATMIAPSGLGPYTWNGPSGSSTSQSIVTSIPGNYSLTMNPAGICNPISKIVNLQFVPPTTVTASPANICASGTNTSSTLSASGASSYTWMPGGSNQSSIVVSPSSSTVYTLTARTGTCMGTYTIAVTVNPDPVLNVLSSNSSVCPGQPVTLTAFGASSYAWSPGALTGSMVTVTQSVATTYTTIGTSAAGCTSTFTTTVGINPAPTIQIFNFSPTLVCSGDPVSMIATGASITWMPGNINTPNVVFNPTTTTTYTALGASGTCTNSATILITVDPGPSMTLSANPAQTCPGNTTTLSVVAPSAVGAFTWNPGAINASSVVITPTLAGGYSVSAVNALGCRNTQTINPVFSPIPTIAVSPANPTVCAGNSRTLTASGATSYTWMPGNLSGASAVFSPTITTTYTVTGANGAGCVGQTTVMLTVVPIPTISASASPTSVCAGGCATITPSGASSYTIQGNNFVVCPTTSTVYAITGANASGCVSSPVSVSLTVNPNPTVTASAAPATICAGSSSTLSANAPGAVSYTWSTGANTPTIQVSPGSSQTYTVRVTNANSCTATTLVTVSVNPIPAISITPANPTVCTGNSRTLTASGASSYTWMPGNLNGASAVLSPTSSTTYTVMGTSGPGCVGQSTVMLTVVPIPTISASASPTSVCAGGCATITPSGASSYTIQGNNFVVCPTSSTVYAITGANASGCVSSPVSVSINVTPNPTVTASAAPATICAGSSSTLSANAPGAVSYTWSTGANTPTIQVSPGSSQTYTVRVTNANSCTATALVTVSVNPIPAISIAPANPTVCTGSSRTLTASGASSYTWMPGNLNGASAVLSPTSSTTYTVMGTSGPGCVGQSTVMLTVVPIPTISASASPTSVCAGGCATITPSGASSYTIQGNNFVVCPTSSTVYAITGANASGCVSSPVSVSINVTPNPVLTTSASPATICAGGSSTLSASGAITYTWSTGANTPTIQVSPGSSQTYTVRGTNASGCTSTSLVPVNVTPVPSLSIIATSASICVGRSTTLSASGASSYTWMPGNLSGNSIVVSPSVNTTYTLTGSTGACVGQTTRMITVAPVPTISAPFNPSTICAGSCATLNASGAVSYTMNGLSAIACPTITSSYTVAGTDANGCVSAPFVGTLSVLPAPNILATANPGSICPGDSALVSASGGTAYTWQPGNLSGTSFYAKPLTSTIYTVTGTASSGCSRTSTVAVNVSPVAPITVTASPGTICSGGSATLSAGGSSNYIWQPGGLSGPNVFVAPSVTTIYTLTGNTGGCQVSTTVQVAVDPSPTVNISSTSTSICAGASATISLSGASTYSWSDGSSAVSRVVTPASSTTYTIIGFSSAGCPGNPATITINVGSTPVITTSASSTGICNGGSVTISASGASNYNWQPGNLSGQSVTVSPGTTTTYSVTGTGPGSCSGTTNITIQVSPSITLGVSANPTAVCAGGSATLSANGAGSYTWAPGTHPGTASITVNPSSSTIYTVTGTSGVCSVNATVGVQVVPTPTISISPSSSSLCTGGCATLSASGSSSYSWSTGATSTTISVCPAVTSTYAVIGSVGSCSSIAITTIVVDPVPSLSISSSADPVCAGSSAVLSVSGAGSYTWSTGSNLSSITVAPPVTTVYTVTGSNGNCSSTALYTLTVIPANTITLTATSASVCEGYTVGLTATGVPSVNWLPVNSTSNPLVDTPLATTVYTAVSNHGGCTSSATISVNVAPLPGITLTAVPAAICPGQTTSLSAAGASTYSWLPLAVTGASITDNPATTTTYTVIGANAAGCSNFSTITVPVLPVPVLSLSASASSVCPAGNVTLSATGATNYIWSPGSQTGNTVVVSPGAPTTYTVSGDNGACSGTATIFINTYSSPSITALASSASVCPGNTVQINASGAINYTWAPGGQTGSTVIESPGASTSYTVTGEDSNGCTGSTDILISVIPMPGISAAANPSAVCEGGSVSLTGSGANSYTWNPGGHLSSTLSVTPAVSTVYTLLATDGNCTGSFTVPVLVIPNPVLTVSPVSASVCAGTSVTLTASGAGNYTWQPGGNTSSVTVETPVSSTTYTVLADNGGLCFSSATVDVMVTPGPQNVTASSTGTVGCTSLTATLSGNASGPNVSYLWTGPSGFSSTTQDTVISGIWGVFSLSVIDNNTGCVTTVTVDVPTDNTIPSVTATVSGDITCRIADVVLDAQNTTTNAVYNWSGPGGFSSSIQTPTVNIAGLYTVIVTDPLSSCSSTVIVTVNAHTYIPVTASITPATCDGQGNSNNDGSISVSGFGASDKYDIVSGTSYTGSATYATAQSIPAGGIINNALANPSTTLAYTIRFFDQEHCEKDTTLYLEPVDCSLKHLGIAKAASVAPVNRDGSYDVTYKVVVKNFGTSALHDIQLTENLNTTFPAPSTFTVSAIRSVGSLLSVNNAFNGNSLTNLLSSGTNSLAGQSQDTLVFTVKVRTLLFFTEFRNTITGQALNSNLVALSDSSQAGLDPDPDQDGNPGNNNMPTVISFSPATQFEMTKTGEIQKSDNGGYDITYTITVYNSGNDTLRQVSLNDTLYERAVRHPARYVMKSGPFVSGQGLVADLAYNGHAHTDLIDPALSHIPPGTSGSVYFTIHVTTGGITSFTNTAHAMALSPISATENTVIRDTASVGLSVPGTQTLFIPEGFSPDGDNINDFFVIKGLPDDKENAITIFNRWGNKVYHNPNYDNSWNGTPNVGGTLGKDKLPPGTYYYVLETKGSEKAPVTGFVVLQY